jgi:hypothetical protein
LRANAQVILNTLKTTPFYVFGTPQLVATLPVWMTNLIFFEFCFSVNQTLHNLCILYPGSSMQDGVTILQRKYGHDVIDDVHVTRYLQCCGSRS